MLSAVFLGRLLFLICWYYLRVATIRGVSIMISFLLTNLDIVDPFSELWIDKSRIGPKVRVGWFKSKSL